MAGLNSGGKSSGSYRPIFAKASDDFFTKFDTCTAEIIMKSTIFNKKYDSSYHSVDIESTHNQMQNAHAYGQIFRQL